LTGPEGSTINPVSDATLYVKTNSNNPNFKFNFIDLYPTELGEMNFTSSDNSQDFITATATFNYGYYEAIKI
jgi:hypothetical protein